MLTTQTNAHLQVKLHYTEKALRLIASKAMAKNTGARGLRALLESILTDAMYEVYNKQLNGLHSENVISDLSVIEFLKIKAHPFTFQIPDVKSGNDRVDAVVVDEESVGSVNSPGCGGKVLRGDGALEKYLADTKLEDVGV